MTTCCINKARIFVLVKWLTTILSLYLLGLSVWPCSDESLPATGQRGFPVLLSADTAQPGPTHQHEDLCSPFCSCTCCAATSTMLPDAGYPPIRVPVVIRVAVASFFYKPLRSPEPLTAIWQPPQIRV